MEIHHNPNQKTNPLQTPKKFTNKETHKINQTKTVITQNISSKFLIILQQTYSMKNSECTIYIMFKDKWLQKFRKEQDSWRLYSRNGTVRPCTAEQLISHLLPPLAGIKGPNVTVKVEPDNIEKQKISPNGKC
jgi:hypothetical protein